MNNDRYLAACHAMQTGVAYDQAKGSDDGSPKHLRVGINSALCDQAGLVKLLIAKGLFTEEEYLAAITESMEEEVARYQRRLTERYGVSVTLR